MAAQRKEESIPVSDEEGRGRVRISKTRVDSLNDLDEVVVSVLAMPQSKKDDTASKTTMTGNACEGGKGTTCNTCLHDHEHVLVPQ